jgi:hypothetical protein
MTITTNEASAAAFTERMSMSSFLPDPSERPAFSRFSHTEKDPSVDDQSACASG